MSLLDSMKTVVTKLNDKGIPLPLIRLNGTPTFTGTLTLISFVVALLGLIGKISGFLGNVDVSGATYLFGINLAAYLGRRLTSNSVTKTVTIEEEKK